MKLVAIAGAALLGIATPSLALDPALRLTQYGHTAWRVRDGALPGAVNAIAQTRDGYLWIATSAGLLRFDGVRFEPWRPPDGTTLRTIVALLGASDGSLWIGVIGGLLQLKDGHLTTYATVGYFGTLLEDRDGTIWAGHTRDLDLPPLCSVRRNQFRCVGLADGLPMAWVEALYLDARGVLWVGGAGGVCTWPAGRQQWEPIPGRASFGDKFGVSGLAPDDGGALWAAAGQYGMWRRTATGWDRDASLNSIHSATLFTDRQGSLWIGDFSEGLLRRWHGRTDRFTAADGLTSNRVIAAFEDSEGNVWVGTNVGLDRFRDVSVVTMTAREGLLEDALASVAASKSGGVWIAHHDEGMVRVSDAGVVRLTPADGFPRGEPTSLLEDS